MHLLLIINPTAGHYSARRQTRFIHQLQKAGFEVTISLTRYRGHGAEITQAALTLSGAGPETPPPDIIMAGGGDGTIAEIAQAILNHAMPDRPCALALWPVGSANVLARELGIPFDDAANAALLATGQARPLWPGLLIPGGQTGAAPQLFLQMAGVGLDGWVVQHLSTKLKKRIGRLAYLITALRLPFAGQIQPFTTTIDGQAYRGYLTIISKGQLYGGPYRVLPEACHGRPGFSLFILHRLNPFAIMGHMLARISGRIPTHPAFTFTHGNNVRCTSSQPIPAQSDGDYRGLTPLHITSSPRPLHVIAPADRGP